MGVNGVAVFMPFLFHLQQCGEYNIAVSGCRVTLEWTLSNTPLKSTTSFKICDSLTSIIAEMVDKTCIVADDSSTYCNIHDSKNTTVASLTILNVTARHSGMYTLKLVTGMKEVGSRSIKLVVVGKPNVMEVGKPILGRPFQMTCNSSNEIESVMYRWRVHGALTKYFHNGSIHSVPSLRMTDHLSQVTCQACLTEPARKFSTLICEHNACSTDSDPYTIQVLYGPDNLSLSLNESNFYLKDHEFFTIDCYANCNPNCTFLWKGHKTIESRKLEITNFESKMAGNYTCYVTNQEINITSKSKSIILHHLKDDNYNDGNLGAVRPEQYWMSIAIISVFLLIFGVAILVTSRHKCTTRAIDSTELCRVSERQTDTEVIWKELERLNRLLNISSIQDRVSVRRKRSDCPNVGKQNDCGPNIQEDPYSTIDDGVLSADYDHEIENPINENSHKTGSSIAFYDYAHSLEMCHVETADLHATDKACITPISDFVRSFEVLQNEKEDMLETDHAYLTLIDDLEHSNEKCHVEETDMNETDETYITPILGL